MEMMRDQHQMYFNDSWLRAADTVWQNGELFRACSRRRLFGTKEIFLNSCSVLFFWESRLMQVRV